MQVTTLVEGKRGCGYRKAGKGGYGIYLMGPGDAEPCERLSFPLDICPTCGAGVKFSRAFTWVNPMDLLAPDIEPPCQPDELPDHNCEKCWVCSPHTVGPAAGLMWVGLRYYSVESFLAEAQRMGVSKRVPHVPQGFELGKHVIYLAHIRACVPEPEIGGDPKEGTPGIFWVFRPTHVDIVIDDANHIPEGAANLVDRLGEERARLVKVVCDTDTQVSYERD